MYQASTLQIIRRQVVTFSLVTLVGLSLTTLVIVFAPRKYHSHAKFMLRLGRENVTIDPTVSTTGELASLHRTRDSEVQSAVQAMRSRRILESVLETIGHEPILKGSLSEGEIGQRDVWSSIKGYLKSLIARLDPIDDREKAIIALQSGFKIDAERDSSVIDIWFKTKTPELAERVVDTWVKAYQAEHARINLSEGSYAFFQQQERQLLDTLARSRDTLQAKKSASGLLTISGGQNILERQMEQSRLSRMEVQTQLAGARARLDSLTSQQEQTPWRVLTGEATSHTSDARQQMRDRLYALEIEERGLSGKYAPDHPALQAVRRQLADAQRVYETYQDATRETVEGINPLYVTIAQQISLERANVDALESELAATDATLDSLAQQFIQLNQHEAELAVLQRQVDVLELQYQTQFIKREQARLGEELQRTSISNLSLIQDPTLERRPVSPNKTLCGLLGGLASLLAAAGLVAWRETGYQMQFVEQYQDHANQASADSTLETLPTPPVMERRRAEANAGGLVPTAGDAR